MSRQTRRPPPGNRRWPHGALLVPVIPLLVAAIIVGSLFLTGRLGATTPTPASPSPIASAQPTPGPTSTPTAPAATPSPTPVPGGGGFVCGPVSGGGTTSTPGAQVPVISNVQSVRAASHNGYDRFVIDLGQSPVPAYRVVPQSSPIFIADFSGRTITLQGQHGILVVLDEASNHSGYVGATDIHYGLPTLKEARLIGDFEGKVSWALGISSPGCVRVVTLTGPSRIVIDVQT